MNPLRTGFSIQVLGRCLSLVILLTILPLPATGDGWSSSGTLAAFLQGYDSTDLSETILASDVNISVKHKSGDLWSTGLKIVNSIDLYNELAAFSLNTSGQGEMGEWRVEAGLERNEPGHLDRVNTVFNADSLMSGLFASSAYDRVRLRTRWGQIGDNWDLGLDLGWSDLRYDEPVEGISDLREIRLVSNMGVQLPAESRFNVRGELTDQSYRQRPASNSTELLVEGRSSRDLGDEFGISLLAEILKRGVADGSSVAHYDRPDGSRWRLGAGVDWFHGLKLDLSATVAIGREDWEEGDHYYRDGNFTELELLGGISAWRGSRLDLYCGVETFSPDSLSGDDWTLSRGDERRLEFNLFLTPPGIGELTWGLGVITEDLRVTTTETDHYLLAQLVINLDFRVQQVWHLALAVDLDQYRSRYGEGDEEREHGFGTDFSLSRRMATFLLTVNYRRSEHFSFLLEDGFMREWETGLRVDWRP